MPIRILIETKNDAFPDQGGPSEYIAAVSPLLDQVASAISDFAKHRIDRKTAIKDRDGKVCVEIEILRF